MDTTICICETTSNTGHLSGAARFREVSRIIIRQSQANNSKSVLEPHIFIQRIIISSQSDSNDSSDDEISEEETAVKLVTNRTRRHHNRHRPLSHHASSSSSSNASTPVHRGTSTGTASQESSSIPQSPSSTNQTDESSSPSRRRRPSSKSRWSPASLKHALCSLSLNALLLPDSNNNKEKKKKKRILRSPVAYTYVKGLSGLPTQRVPLKQTSKGRITMWPSHYYPPTAELCCLQRAAALSALCLDR